MADLTKQGVTLVRLAPSQRAAFRTAVQPVWAKWTGTIGAELVDAAKGAVARAAATPSRWSRVRLARRSARRMRATAGLDAVRLAGRRVGMISTQSSYGVRTSRAPSRASSVPPSATTVEPATGSANANSSVSMVTTSVTSIARCAGGGALSRWASRNSASSIPKWRRKRSVACFATSRRRALPVLAAFDQQRVARVDGVVEGRVVAQPLAGGMAGVDHDVLGHADRAARAPRPCAAARPARAAGTGRSSSAGRAGSRCRRRPAAARGRARGRAVCAAPSSTSAVHSRLKSSSTQRDANGSAGSNARKASTLANVQRERAAQRAARPRASSQSLRDRAAHFVAVRQRLDRHVRPGALRREAPDVGNAGVAGCHASRSGNATSIGGAHRRAELA